MEAYQQLEEALQSFTGREQIVCCSSGTSALHLTLETLQIRQRSLVLIPDFCMIAIPRAVSLAGYIPVTVGCDSKLNLDINVVDYACQKLEGQIKAVVAVHTYGRQCEIDSLIDLSKKYNFSVIEDLAEVHGLQPHSESYAGCWSFYKNKTVSGEEGGCIAYNDKDHANHARQLRCLGFTAEHDFKHIPRGHNYRMSNKHAEQILESLRYYSLGISSLELNIIEQLIDKQCPEPWRLPKRQAPWVYDFRIPNLTCQQQIKIVSTLIQSGIPARHAFKPVHAQTEYQDCKRFRVTSSIKASSEVIYLPFNCNINYKRTFDLILEVLKDNPVMVKT